MNNDFKKELKVQAKRFGLTAEQTETFLKCLAMTAVDYLSPERPVKIRGFGTIKMMEKKRKIVGNPNAGGVAVCLPGHRAKFIPSQAMKQKADHYIDSKLV